MQHILNIAFDFDDEKIKKVVEGRIEEEMHETIEREILGYIAPYTDSRRLFRNWDMLLTRVEDEIKKVIWKNEDAIIENAATRVADSIRRTKAWREKYKEVLDESGSKEG